MSDMRVTGLWLLTSPTTSPDNPPLLCTYYSARNCLAHTPHPCPPPDEAHSLACSGRCWPQPPDKGETQARIPAPGFSLFCCYSLTCCVLGAAGRSRLIRERARPGSPLLGSPLLVAARSIVHLSYLLSVAKSSGLEMSFCGCLRYAEDKEGPTGHC